MASSRKSSLAAFMVILMLSHVATAAVSSWSGPTSLAGQSKTVDDAFQVPGNATVIDAWLHVDETGVVPDGSGLTWTGEDVPGNFSSGIFSNSMMGKFDGAMSLSPDSAVSNIDTFSSASLQLSSHWTQSGSIWDAVNPSSLGGNVSGVNRSLAHGTVPATAAGGGVVAATLPGQGLPASSAGALVTPQISLPAPINHFNLTFSQWNHLDVGDGAWVEYKLDTGIWTYLEPNGGYPSTISSSAPVPNGANGSGFGVYGDGNYSGWDTPVFNLDNLSGISGATYIKFRFKVWTDSNSTSRPGWYLDQLSITNVGNSVGYWHHGCYVSTGTCSYSNNAQGMLESDVDLSSTTSGAEIQTRLEFDLEGSSYDNFCIELSTNNGTTWTDISSSGSGGSTTTSCRSRTGSIPGSSYTLPNGTTVIDESGGFVVLDFSIPIAMIGSTGTSKIRYYVETDSSVQSGGTMDEREGLTVDWYKVVESNGTVLDANYLSNSTSATHYGNAGATNDWAYLQIGSGGMSMFDGFEDSPALPPGGWSITNQNGHVGWQFGSVCSNYTDGPSAFPSASLGFGTNLCGDYDASSDNSLISPNYYVPLGASARFVWKHWMCSENNYDGGALYVSVNGGTWNQAYVNTGNGTTWYDAQIGSSTFAGTDVWDGSPYVNAAGQWSCSSLVSIPWIDMAYDVSNLSGNNVSFKFRQMGDSIVQDPGWYVDDIGLEVDWFESEGEWLSPLIPTSEYGYGFVDADIILPNNTWYGVSVMDLNGAPIDGHDNLSLPLSLASIDRDLYPSIRIKVHLGTNDEYYSPLISELSVGATRYFGEGNGWNIPSNIQRNATGSWENTGGITSVITGESGITTRPVQTVMVSGEFAQVTASLVTRGTHVVSTTVNNSILDLGAMRSHISPKVDFAPGATLDRLAFRAEFVQPGHDASIDLAVDGTDDWVFPANPAYGSYGWQTRLYNVSVSHSENYNISAGSSDNLTVLIPEDAIPRSLVLGLNPVVSGAMSVNSGSLNIATNWTTQSRHLELNSLTSIGVIQDATGRNWSTINIEFTATENVEFTLGSFAIGYTLFENVSGLGQVVKTYHEANSNNGLEPLVDVPISWSAAAGGVGISGGVYHENMITNHPFTVPTTWYPNGQIQGFTTQHHHLLGNENIAEIHLIGTDSSGDQVNIVLSNLTDGGVFSQTSGEAMLKIDNSSILNESNGRWTIDWMFEVDWDWNDSTSMTWTAQGFDADGEGLSPASALSGGVGTQASENDLQVDTWKVLDVYGHTLSDVFSPSYPFWAKAGSQVLVSGTVRFENTLDMRPLMSDFVVAVNVSGTDVVLNATSDGHWTGLVSLPENGNTTELTPYVLRAGPIEGAAGAVDVTLQNPVVIRLDNESPWVENVQVDNGQRLIAADGYTWDPSNTVTLQVAITDTQALGDSITLHYWRSGGNGTNGDDSNGDGAASPGEYQTMEMSLPEGIAGERIVTFSGIDVSGLEMNAKFSIWFSSVDYSGFALTNGGSAGIENDMATMIIATNEPTEILPSSLVLDSYNEYLLAGQNHTLSMEISDANGIESIDLVRVKLLGNEEDEVGVMTWEPRNGAMYTPENSQLTLHDVAFTELGDNFLVEWKFSLDWTFDENLIGEYAMPAIVIFDDDDLNHVALLTNQEEIRWKLDNDFEVVISSMSDNTPPLSLSSSEHIYVKPGDDLTFTGFVQFFNSGAPIDIIPDSGLEVKISLLYGSEPINSTSSVTSSGNWSAGLILPGRLLLEGNLTVSYAILGIISPGNDMSAVTTVITVDDIAPVVDFTTSPRDIDDSDLEVLPFTISIIEEGGMPAGDLTVNWAYVRNGIMLPEGSSSALLQFISTDGEFWSYSGTLDFTQGVNVSLQEDDSLIWWIEVTDLAGNSAGGTGTSMIDAMEPIFTVLSFDITVTNIEIALANGSTPTDGKVVEGEEIGVTVYVRNLGTKVGTVKISLMEDLRENRDWLEHGSSEITLAPGQTVPALTLIFETHGSGYQNLAINITGMDQWMNNPMLPHCAGSEGNASCDLDVESDMPIVISSEAANSGFGSTGFWLLIMGLLLVGMASVIVVLLRRDRGESELYFDDDDSWDDAEEDELEQKVTPILPPLAPDRPVNLDKLSEKLEVDTNEEIEDSEIKSEQDVEASEEVEEISEPIEVEEDLDPWADVDYSETEEE